MSFNIRQMLLVLFLSATMAQSAKILAIFPFPGPSQFIVVKTYLETLAARGHELTVISHQPQKEKLENYRDIKLEFPDYYENVVNKLTDEATKDDSEFAVDYFRNITLFALENVEVKALLQSQAAHFDLVIIETAFTEALYAIGPHFKAPLIGVSSFGTDAAIDDLVGNTSPLSYLPLTITSLSERMNFWQRLENLELALGLLFHRHYNHLPMQVEIYKKYFPKLSMTLEEVMKNFSLILLNQHFSLSFPRPYVPAMVQVGGMHISHKPAALPKDMADFIDGAVDGVIYFSMGSNVRSKDLSAEKLETLLRVFGSLKQRVLWKFENTELPRKPANVLISKWFPQADILAHPNVKLFITHGGLLSTMEAIHHAKPVVGLPVFYDQFGNMERAKSAGFGLALDFYNLKEPELRRAIEEVLTNPSYERVAKEISAHYHDRPMTPLDEAIYWTEYVLRYNGARHLRVAALDLSFLQYHSLDILGYLFAKWLLLPLVLIFAVLKFIKGKIFRKSKRD